MALADVPETRVQEDLAACGRALQVDPGLAEGLVLQADLLWRLGEQKFKRGTDPLPELAASTLLAERAIALDPRDVEAHNHLAISHRLLAQWKKDHGMDPRADIRQGIEAARRAVEIQPEMPSSHANLGTAYLVLAQDQQRRGADPRQATSRAIASYQEAEELNPQSLPAFIGLGNSWNIVSEVEIAQGADPSASIGKAAAALEHAAALNPRSAPIYNNLGNAHLTLGEYLLARGDDPRGALDRAALELPARRRAEAGLLPGVLQPRVHLAQPGRGAPRPGAGPAARPRPGQRRAGGGAAPQSHRRRRLSGTGAGEAPRRPLADAAAAGPRARPARRRRRARPRRGAQPPAAGRPLHPGADRPRPRRGRAGRRRPARRRCGEGLERIGKALAINAGEARYLALRGLSRVDGGPAGDRSQPPPEQAARRAVASLEAALRTNPLLQREYGPALAEARLDAGPRREPASGSALKRGPGLASPPDLLSRATICLAAGAALQAGAKSMNAMIAKSTPGSR